MASNHDKKERGHLPAAVTEFIGQAVRKMRYRRKVRAEVEAELAAHFEDELDGCAEDEREEGARRLIAEFGNPKLLGVLMSRAKKRCRPLWQKALVRGAQTFGILILYLLVCSIPLLVGKPTLSVNYVEWLNDFVRDGRDEADNARSYYEEARELLVAMPEWLSENMSSWPADFNDADSEVLTGWLEDNRAALDMFREGSERAGYWSRYHTNETRLDKDLVGNAMEILPGFRKLAFAMRWQIRHQADAGNVEAAMSDSVALVRLGTHLEGQGLLIEQLVGIAVEAIGTGEVFKLLARVDVPADVLANTYRHLEAQFDRQRLIVSMEAEKVFWYDGIQRGFTDDGEGNGRVLARGLPYVVTNNTDTLWKIVSFDLPDKREMMARVDRHYAEFAGLFSKTPWELQNEPDAVTGTETTPIILETITSGVPKINRQSWAVKTDREALLTTLAAMRYEKTEGRYPADLDELVGAGYLKQLPIDPFSSRTLVYKRTADGFTLYSFGPNLRDDDGISGTGSSGRSRKWADDGDTVFWPLLTRQVRPQQ